MVICPHQARSVSSSSLCFYPPGSVPCVLYLKSQTQGLRWGRGELGATSKREVKQVEIRVWHFPSVIAGSPQLPGGSGSSVGPGSKVQWLRA